VIFCHSFVSDVILRRFFTKPRLILACDKKHFYHVKKYLRCKKYICHYWPSKRSWHFSCLIFNKTPELLGTFSNLVNLWYYIILNTTYTTEPRAFVVMSFFANPPSGTNWRGWWCAGLNTEICTLETLTSISNQPFWKVNPSEPFKNKSSAQG
jgi:hypothetical protein